MFLEERQEAILNLLSRDGKVRVKASQSLRIVK